MNQLVTPNFPTLNLPQTNTSDPTSNATPNAPECARSTIMVLWGLLSYPRMRFPRDSL